MKTLLVLRHAKSDRSDSSLRDHDRPLAPRGEADTPRMGAALAALDCLPERIITSTAVRARDTAHLVATAMAYDGPLLERDSLDGGGTDGLLDALRACDDAAATVLFVGHNPDLEELVSLLTAGEPAQSVIRLPTAALACLTLDIPAWSAIAPACGLLEWLLTPRIVAPFLRARRNTKQ